MSGLGEVARGLNRAEERAVDRLRKTIIIESENHFALGREATHVVELRGGGEFEILFRVDHATGVVCRLGVVAHAPIHACFGGIHGIEVELTRAGEVIFAFTAFHISHFCVLFEIFFRLVQVGENALIGSFERVDRLVLQIEGIGVGQAIFCVGLHAIVRAVEAQQVEVQEGAQTVGLAAHQAQARIVGVEPIEVAQHVVHVRNDLILRRPNVVDRRTHGVVLVIVVQNLRVGVRCVEIAEHLADFVEETVGQVLAVELFRGHRAVDAVHGIVIALRTLELHVLREFTLRLHIEKIVARSGTQREQSHAKGLNYSVVHVSECKRVRTRNEATFPHCGRRDSPDRVRA